MSKECCEHEGEGVPAAPPVGPGLAFRVHGMDCAEEVATLKGALQDLVPAEQLGFDVLNGRMFVPTGVPEASVVAQSTPPA
jgi:Cd2+/Zn2+-exporting ATPase